MCGQGVIRLLPTPPASGQGLWPNSDALLLEHRQKHEPVFDDNISKQSRKFTLRDERMNSFIAQQSVEAAGKFILLCRQEGLVLEKRECRIRYL